jgi:hypothetical protein
MSLGAPVSIAIIAVSLPKKFRRVLLSMQFLLRIFPSSKA